MVYLYYNTSIVEKMEEKRYFNLYEDKLVRVNFTDSQGYCKVATGNIIDEFDKKIIIKTVKDEIVTVSCAKIDNILEVTNKVGYERKWRKK